MFETMYEITKTIVKTMWHVRKESLVVINHHSSPQLYAAMTTLNWARSKNALFVPKRESTPSCFLLSMYGGLTTKPAAEKAQKQR